MRGGLNTLIFSDPFAKVVSTSAAVSQLGKTLYIDLDTTFSAYAAADIIFASPVLVADVFMPSKGKLMNILKEVIDRAFAEQYSLIIIDSINSFYNMYDTSNEGSAGRINHFLGIVIMLLTHYSRELGIPILITSMLRYHKSKGWVLSPASRRLIQYSSASRFNTERIHDIRGRIGSEVSITVQKHPSIPAGEKFSCSSVSIALRRLESNRS